MTTNTGFSAISLAIGDIGPFDYTIHPYVVDYIEHSPTPNDFKCLDKFLRDLSIVPTSCLHSKTPDGFTLQHCNHTIVLTRQKNREMKITLIKTPGGTWYGVRRQP